MNLFDGCVGNKLTNGLVWLNEPEEWLFNDTGLIIKAKAGTDFFRPYGETYYDSACFLYREITGDFTVATDVKAELFNFGDAAALSMRADETRWAKLCIEQSPIGEVSLVSVVTNPWSDDSNNELISSAECHLRLTRKGNLFGMHYSLDGTKWRFVRAFGFELPENIMVGIHVQAPSTSGCRALYRFFIYTAQPVENFRSGD
jgi:regulation of enolase protein 1 (concanavalin A-like superfamily)